MHAGEQQHRSLAAAFRVEFFQSMNAGRIEQMGAPAKLYENPKTTFAANFLGVLARNGRKNELRGVIRAFRRLAAEHRGEVTADVTTARPLNDGQIAALKQQLRARAGREVTIDATVDPNILGGIVIKLGSQQIDASIRTKLNRLASAMKG